MSYLQPVLWAYELQGARTRVVTSLVNECSATGSRNGLHRTIYVVSDEQCRGGIDTYITYVENTDSVFTGKQQRVEIRDFPRL